MISLTEKKNWFVQIQLPEAFLKAVPKAIPDRLLVALLRSLVRNASYQLKSDIPNRTSRTKVMPYERPSGSAQGLKKASQKRFFEARFLAKWPLVNVPHLYIEFYLHYFVHCVFRLQIYINLIINHIWL